LARPLDKAAEWVAGPAAALAPGAPRMCEPCTPDGLLEAVRGLRVAEPDLGVKPLLAKLREQQPDLGAATKEVREALAALKAESEAAKAAAAALPAADESAAPLPVALSLACIGCARLPSDMDDGREKHPICDKCLDLKLPTTYLCGKNCPANPGAWELHGAFHKRLRKSRKMQEDGGVLQQRTRETAERQARYAAQTGDEYDELLAEGTQYQSKDDTRKAAKAYREAIALRPDEPVAYYNLGAALGNSGHFVEAAQRFLEAKARCRVGSENWAEATAWAFDMLLHEVCAEVAKPEWWSDEGLKALSARVLRAAPNEEAALDMRAIVLSGVSGGTWEAGPRSAAELKEAATCFYRSAALCDAPAWKAEYSRLADECRIRAEAI
jgi:tetratricopeptide (TPR) repeat protein